MVDRTEPRLLLGHLFLRTVHLVHFQSAACFVILTPEQQMDSVLTVSLQVREQESQGPQRKLSREPGLEPRLVHLTLDEWEFHCHKVCGGDRSIRSRKELWGWTWAKPIVLLYHPSGVGFVFAQRQWHLEPNSDEPEPFLLPAEKASSYPISIPSWEFTLHLRILTTDSA